MTKHPRDTAAAKEAAAWAGVAVELGLGILRTAAQGPGTRSGQGYVAFPAGNRRSPESSEPRSMSYRLHRHLL